MEDNQRVDLRERSIQVPANDPFRDDWLSRKPMVEALALAFERFPVPHVLAVDGAYGSGKTTVLRFLAAELRNRGFAVAEVNAWENDYRDPLEPLLGAVKELFGEEGKWLDWARDVTKSLLPSVVGSTIPVPGGKDLSKHLIDRLTQKSALEKIREGLKSVASKCDKHLVIIIDELDRCKPSHAVQLLEWVKHAFSVDGVHFAFGVHLGQLAHSVAGVYGIGFDGTKYLERFFHTTISVRSSSLDELVRQEMENRGLIELFRSNRRENPMLSSSASMAISDARAYFGRGALSPRAVSRAIALITSVITMLPPRHDLFLSSTLALVFLKMTAPDVYRNFITNKVSDLDVTTELERRGVIPKLEEVDGDNWPISHFKAVLIAAYRSMLRENDGTIRIDHITPLVKELQSLSDDGTSDEEAESDPTKWHNDPTRRAMEFSRHPEILLVIDRLELLAPEAVGVRP